MDERILDAPVPTLEAQRPRADIRLAGKHVTLAGLKASHAASLYELVGGEANLPLWTWMRHGPFPSLAAYTADLAQKEQQQQQQQQASPSDRLVFAILLNAEPDASNPDGLRPVGTVALQQVELANRACEIGGILFSARLARSRAATEALYLLVRHVFEDLHFRRLAWKCNALNVASARAAVRIGFTYEGTFRQHMIVKGARNRDSRWHSIIDGEWEDRKRALEAWLDDGNFDADGRQRKRLEEFRM